MMDPEVGKQAASRRKRPVWRRWVLGGVILVVLLVAGYVGSLGYALVSTSARIYRGTLPPLATRTEAASPTPAPARTQAPGEATWTPPEVDSPTPVEALPPGRINILVMGTDKRTELQEEAARSDTLIVISVDPQWKTAGILSIPRDLQVPVPGYGLQKINAAYFFGEYDKIPGGGPALAVPTVQQYFGVPIKYYVTINFDGFQKIVDMMGGIDINVPRAIDDPEYPGPYNSYIHVHFDAGCQHMDGTQALEYARTRHADSDFGRALRQQQVIRAVRIRALQLDMLPRYADLINQLGNTIETNIPPDQQWMFVQLAGQIKSSDIYQAQIGSDLVREIPNTGNLALRWDKARPLLNWFFGRGLYADLRPGTVLTPTPGLTADSTGPIGTVVAGLTPGGLETPVLGADGSPLTVTPGAGYDGLPATDTPTPAPAGPLGEVTPGSDRCP